LCEKYETDKLQPINFILLRIWRWFPLLDFSGERL